MKFPHYAATATVAVLSLGTAAAAPETFTIDPAHTYPMFEATHFGISTQRGRFDKTSGKIVLDRAAKTGSIDVTVDATSISMGFETWNQHVKGEGLFNTAKFPTITFKSRKLVFDGDNVVGADGEFTLRGITKPLRLKVSNFACIEHPVSKRLVCGAEVTAEIKRSEFGMTKGIPAVGDSVRLMSPIEAIKE